MKLGANSRSSFGEKYTSTKYVSKFMDHKWRFIPFWAELEPKEKEYPLSFLWGALIIDFIQVLSLILLPEYSWSTAMHGFTTALSVFNIPIYRFGTNSAFYCSLALCLVATVCYISFVVYMVFRCVLMKRFIPGSTTFDSRLFRFYHHMLALFSTVLFIPLFLNYLALSFPLPGSSKMLWYSSISTSSWMWKFGLSVCCVGIPFHAIISILLWNLSMVTSARSEHPLRVANTFPDTMYLVLKVFLCIFCTEFFATDDLIFYSILTVIASAVIIILFVLLLPYYVENVGRLRATALWSFFIYSFLALSSDLESASTFFRDHNSADLIILLTTFPFVTFVFYRYVSLFRVSVTYKKAFKGLKNGEISYPVVYFPKNLPRYPNFFAHNRVFLDNIESTGYPQRAEFTDEFDPQIAEEVLQQRALEHESIGEKNKDLEWVSLQRRRFIIRHFIAPYIDYVFLESDVELSTRFLFDFERLLPVKLSGYQLRYAATLFIKGLQQFEYSGNVHLAFIQFLVDQADQYTAALDEIERLEREELSLLVNYRLWKLEVEVVSSTKACFKNRVSAFSHAKDVHSLALQRVVEIWHNLMQDSHLKEEQLISSNRMLMISRADARKDYENLIYQDAGNLEVLCCYAVFADQLLGDKDLSNQCLHFVHQFVHNREEGHHQGSSLEATINASVTQLKLALQAARRANDMFQKRSKIRKVHFVFIVFLALIICLNVGALAVLFVKRGQIASARDDIYNWGQIRTLGTQIGLKSTSVYYASRAGSSVTLDTKKDLLGLMRDFSTLFNSVIFSEDAKFSKQIYTFLHDQPGGQLQGNLYNVWTYIGLAFANMNNLLDAALTPSPELTARAKWLSTEFTDDLNNVADMIIDKVQEQADVDLKLMKNVTLYCMLFAMLLEWSLFAVLLFGHFYVKGIRFLVYGVMRLLPKEETRALYRRTMGQHNDLDTFLKMRPSEKVQRLMAVLRDPEMYSLQIMQTGLLLPSLFSVVPSQKGDNKFVSSLKKKKSEGESDDALTSSQGDAKGFEDDDTQSMSMESENFRTEGSEVKAKSGFHPSAEQMERFMTMNCLGEKEGEIQGTMPKWEMSAIEEAISVKDSRGSLKSSGGKWGISGISHSVSQQEYENVVSGHALLLRNNQNSAQRLFTFWSVLLSVLIVLLSIASIELGSRLLTTEDTHSEYNTQEVKKNEAFMDACSEVLETVISVANFAISGEQRYFKKYIAAQSSTGLSNFKKLASPLKSLGVGNAPAAPFEMSAMYRGLLEVTDIVMRLLCTQYAENCVTDVPFDQIYLSTLTWDAEPTLSMIQMAPHLGVYETFFNVLKGSTVDLKLSAADQTSAVFTILCSSVFNTYFSDLIRRMQNLDNSPVESAETTTNSILVACVVVSGVTCAVIIADFLYNFFRKRSCRKWILHLVTSLTMLTLCAVCVGLVGLSFSHKKNVVIDDVLTEARSVYKNSSEVVFNSFWNPLMYIASNGAIIWNYNTKNIFAGTNFLELAQKLQAVAGQEMVSRTLLNQLKTGIMVSVILMYEATKALPELAEDVSIFSPSYMDSFTWDFQAEKDYLTVLAKYYLVTPENGFYSTRAADLALPDADKIALAKNTLVSFRADDVWSNLIFAIRQSNTKVTARYSSSGASFDTKKKHAVGYTVLSSVVLVIILLFNFVLLVKYCRNMISTASFSAAMRGQEGSSKASSKKSKESSSKLSEDSYQSIDSGGKGIGRVGDGKGRSRAKSPFKSISNVVDSNVLSITEAEISMDQKMEFKSAEKTSVEENEVDGESGTILESVSTSSEKKVERIYTFSAFAMVFVLLVISLAVLFLVLIYSNRMLQFFTMIDKANKRRYLMTDAMNSMQVINLDSSAYAVASSILRNSYASYIDVVNNLYFGAGTDLNSTQSRTFVNLENSQDTLLFSRNQFYNNQTFLGSSMTSVPLGGVQIITSDFGSGDEGDYLNSEYYCSFLDMMTYKFFVARGVGLAVDALWLNYLRGCFSYDLETCSTLTFKHSKEIFDPLLVGLQESNDLFMDFIKRDGLSVFAVLIFLLFFSSIAIIVMYLFVFSTFFFNLLRDDSYSRKLLKVLPLEVRSRYPVFEELLEGKKVTKDENQLQRIMCEESRMAIIAIEDKTGSIIRFNEIAEDLLGYPTSEVLGKSISLLLLDEKEGERTAHEQVYEFLRAARSTSKNNKSDMLVRKKNGQRITTSVHFLTVKLSMGNRAIIIFLEEVESKARLHVLTKINQSILDMHEDGIVHIDKSGIIMSANPACHRLFGWRPEELIGQNVTILMPKAVGAYHQEYINRYLERGVKKKVDNLTEVEGLHRDGYAVPLEMIVRELAPPYPSALTQFVAYLRGKETAQEMESASALMDVLHTLSPVPLIQVNANGEVQQLSRSALELFQYKAHEVAAYTFPVQYLIPENIEGTNQESFIQRAHHRGPTSVMAQKRDRSIFPGVVTARQIEYGSGLPYNIFVGYISDISKTLRMEKNGRLMYSMMVRGIVPVIVVDQNGCINFFNTAAAKCFLYTQEEVLGKSYRILCGGRRGDGRLQGEEEEGEEMEKLVDWLEEEAEDEVYGKSRSVYDRRRLGYGQRRSGAVFPIEFIVTKVLPLNLNDEALVILLRDVSEESAIQRNYFMGEMIDALCPMGIVMINHEGIIERFSPAAEECFGYHSSEILGASVQTVIPGITTETASGDTNAAADAEKTFMQPDKSFKKSTPASKTTKESEFHIDTLVKKEVSYVSGRHFDTRSLELVVHAVELSSTLSANFSTGVAVDSPYVLYCDSASTDTESLEATAFYRQIRDMMDTPMLQVSETGVIVYSNSHAASFFQFPSAGALVNKSAAVLFSKQGKEKIQQQLKSAVKEFKALRTNSNMGQLPDRGADSSIGTRSGNNAVKTIVQNDAYPCLHHNGTELSAQFTIVQVSSFLNGTIHFIFYVSSCVIDMEKQLASSFNKLLVEASTLPLLLTDENGIILQTSPHTTQLFGYEKGEDMMGVNLNQILPKTSVERIMQLYTVHEASPKGSEVFITQEVACKKDGAEFPVRMSTRIVGLHTERPLVIFSVKSLERDDEKDSTSTVLRSMMDIMDVPAVLINYRGIIIHLNTSLLSTFGYSGNEDYLLIGKDVGMLMNKSDAVYHPRYVANYFSTHVKYSIDNTVVREVRHRDGHAFYLSVNVREITGVTKEAKDTVFVGYFFPASNPVVQDVTNLPLTTNADDDQKKSSAFSITSVTKDPTPPSPSRAPSSTLVTSTGRPTGALSAMPTEHAGRMVRNLEYWMEEKHGIPLILLGKQDEVLRLSKAAESLLGFFPGEANGSSLVTVLSIDPLNQSVLDTLEQAKEAVTTKTMAKYELPITAKTKRGSVLFLNTFWRDLAGLRSKTLKDWTNMPSIIICLFNTSAQLSATHQKLLCDATVEACIRPTIFINTEGIVSVFNPAAEKCFGLPARGIIGKNVKMLMPSKTAEMHDGFLKKYLSTNKAHAIGATREIIARRMDGSHFSAVICITDLNAYSSRFFIGQLEDVTRRKTNEILAMMSAYIMRHTTSNLLMFDSLDDLVMVSPSMTKALGYERESAVLEQQNILQQILLPTTVRIVREFIQLYQYGGNESLQKSAATTHPDSFVVSQFLDQFPSRRIASVALRLPGLAKKKGLKRSSEALEELFRMEEREEEQYSVMGDVEVRVVLNQNVFVGVVLKIDVGQEDACQYRCWPIARGCANYYSQPMCVVGRNCRIELCNAALSQVLGFSSAEELETLVHGRLFWELFPSFPAPSGAASLEEESRICGSLMEDLQRAVMKANERRDSEESSFMNERPVVSQNGRRRRSNKRNDSESQRPFLRARTMDGSGLMLRVMNVTLIRQIDANTISLGKRRNIPLSCMNGLAHEERPSTASKLSTEPLFFALELSNASADDEATPMHLEAAINPLITQCPVPVVVATNQGIIVNVNKALEKTFDFEAEQLVGKSINILMPRRLGDIHDRYLKEYNAARGTRPLLETRSGFGETKTGTPVRLSITVKEVSNDEGIFFVAALLPENSGQEKKNGTGES